MPFSDLREFIAELDDMNEIRIVEHADWDLDLGTYRVMVHDRNTAGIFMAMAHTGNIIARKYWAKGQACPVAVACGQDPIHVLAGSGRLSIGRRNEYELIGHFRGAPVDVIKEE